MKPLIAITIISTFILATNASAGGSMIWELAGHEELSLGELNNAVLSNHGKIVPGLDREPIDLEATGLVWSIAKDKSGRIYLGTGYDGKIYRVDGNKANLVATTGMLVVTDMAFGADGNLYASTLPDAKIWRVEKPEKIKKAKPAEAEIFATLPQDSEHVWSIAFDSKGKTLFAGTGPNGKIYAVGADKKVNVYLETSEKHILSVQASGDALFAGTSPNALLLKVTAPGKSFALGDFDATEVKSIAVGKDGSLAAGVNKFKTRRKTPNKNSNTTNSSTAKTTKTKSSRSNNNTGYIYSVAKDGASEKLWENDNTHVVCVGLSSNGKIWAGLGAGGKVVSIEPDRTIREELDLDEREVLALVTGESLEFVGTGDAGSAYALKKVLRNSHYLTPVLDAKNVSKWGNTTYSNTGKITVTARSGNTEIPDKTWTGWSPPLANGNKPAVVGAKYIQFKLAFNTPASSVSSLTMNYRPRNARAVITSFDPDTPFDDTKKSKGVVAQSSNRTVTSRPDKENKKELSLTWSVNNPDDDKLRYRLFYRPEGKKMWLPIFKEDTIHTSTRYEWNTDTIPEGRYQLKLVADDSPSNPGADVLSDEYFSVPVEIDNHPPSIKGLELRNGKIRGTATDRFSTIAALDYSIDSGPWAPAECADGIMDSPTEAFEFAPEQDLEPGPHVVTVKVQDRAGNFSTAEIHVDTTGK